ncbi:MAG: citrate/2-methylcitrate synthase [Eubacterium sp.]|nr:citrate/2-methylcitrate synthase [Eubacterium sp.]
MENFAEFKKTVEKYVDMCDGAGRIDQTLYEKYDVKRGLRDSDGRGVLTGLTEISDVSGFRIDGDGNRIPIPGELYFQGYDVRQLVEGFRGSKHGFEETIFLLLFGELPTEIELNEFMQILGSMRPLPENFNRDVIMKAPSRNIMNVLERCVLTLYSYDDDPDDISVQHVLAQSLGLIARFPVIAAYGYQSYRHKFLDASLVIHRPKAEYSTAENILRLLRSDPVFTDLEAEVLDICLVLHAEHGGGNNSTFTTHVISTTGTDTYSTVAGSLGSLKGPRHGGANLKVQQMMADLIQNVKDTENDSQIKAYLTKLLNKEAFDHAGLIYGMGHAIYSLSDPRAEILKEYARLLSEAEGYKKEFELYDRVERIAKELIMQFRDMKKPVCANVDFYSGFVYSVLKIPVELYTPMFAIARIAGWSAHRIEELVNKGKIIRPAYKYVGDHREYLPMEERNW